MRRTDGGRIRDLLCRRGRRRRVGRESVGRSDGVRRRRSGPRVLQRLELRCSTSPTMPASSMPNCSGPATWRRPAARSSVGDRAVATFVSPTGEVVPVEAEDIVLGEEDATQYVGRADVTDLVAAGGAGEYLVGNIASVEGRGLVRRVGVGRGHRRRHQTPSVPRRHRPVRVGRSGRIVLVCPSTCTFRS